MTSKKFERCVEPIGVGGRKCGCCNQYKGIYRKKLNRIIRHRLRNVFEKEIRKELYE